MGNIKSFCCRDDGSDGDERDERARILGDNCDDTNDLYNNNSSNSGHDSLSYGSMNNGTNGKSVEQSALDKIYQKMASNVIDVAPGESMIIQPAEFLERQRAYQSKLNQIKNPLPLKSNNRVTTRHVNNSLNTTSSSSMGLNLTGLANGPNATTNTTNTTTTSGNPPQSNPILQQTTVDSVIGMTASGNSPQHFCKSQEKRRVEYEPISVDDIQLINEISERSLQAVKGLKINSKEQVVTQFQP